MELELVENPFVNNSSCATGIGEQGEPGGGVGDPNAEYPDDENSESETKLLSCQYVNFELLSFMFHSIGGTIMI